MKRVVQSFARHKEWIALGAIILLGLCLRLPNFTESLWFDELWATRIKLGTFKQLVRETVIDVHPPLYYVFSYLWIKLFGDSEIAIRLPPLLFGLAGIVMTFVYGARVAGRRAGLLAAALVAFSPVHIWYSQEARPYTALIFFVLLAAYAGARGANDERPFPWLCLYAATMLAAVFTHVYMLAYLVPTSLASFWLTKGKFAGNRIVRINVAVFGMLALFIGMKAYLFGIKTQETLYLRDFGLFELWMLLFNWIPTGNAIGSVDMYGAHFGTLLEHPALFVLQQFLLLLILLGVLVSGSKNCRDAHPNAVDPILYLACLPAFLLGLNFAGFRYNFIERSAITVLPFFFLVLAKGLLSLPRRIVRPVACWLLGGVVLAALLCHFGTSEQWTIYKPNPDWRAAARFLATDIESQPANVYLYATSPASVLSYYDPRFHTFRTLPAPAPAPAAQSDARDVSGAETMRERAMRHVVAYLRRQAEPTTPVQPNFAIRYATARERPVLPPSERAGKDATVYLIHNRHWSSHFDTLKAELEKSRRLRPMFVYRHGGVEIHGYTMASNGPSIRSR